MRSQIVALLVGFLFAVGLGVSGMTQPQKVIGFLDIAGAWDPSLAFVMIGAIGTHFFFYRWAKRRPSPLLESQFHWPTKRDIDGPLLVGSGLFGAGWGLAGYCPGPAITSLATGAMPVFVFVASMIAGQVLHALLLVRSGK